MDEQNLLKPKILCVDDEDNVLEILKIELKKDFNILTAHDAVKALEILANNTDIAIVISDQKMPGKEGTEFLSEIEQKYPEAVRIILTGYPEYEISYKAIKDGKVYDFIVKKAAYIDEVKKCMLKAMEWYNVQREMRRLKRCVRQLEGFDLIQLLPGGAPVGYEINGALIVDCPKTDPGIIHSLVLGIIMRLREYFGAEEKPADPKVKNLHWYSAPYAGACRWEDFTSLLSKHIRCGDDLEREFRNKTLDKEKLYAILRRESVAETTITDIHCALAYSMSLGQKKFLKVVNQHIIYGDRACCIIQDHYNSLHYKFHLRAEGEKFILQQYGNLEGAGIVKLEQWEARWPKIDGKDIGSDTEFVDAIINKLVDYNK